MEIEMLISIIENGNPKERINAAFELTKLGIFKKINVLVEGLRDKDWEIKSDAIFYLGKIGWYSALNKIGNVIEEESLNDLKNNAIYSLQVMGFPEGVPYIIGALTDSEFQIRDDARNALYRFFGNNILPFINPSEEEFIEDEEKKENAYTSDALEIKIWWANNEKLYTPGKAYFFGEPITPLNVFEKFLEEPFLNDAYLDQLEDITGEKFGKTSKEMIDFWGRWLNENDNKFIAGEKYFYGNKVEW